MCLLTLQGSAVQVGRVADAPSAPLEPAAAADPVWFRELPGAPVADGTADAERLFLPLETGAIISLARETGAVLWTQPRSTRWPPFLAHGRLLVASDSAMLELDAATGTERGAVPLPSPPAGPLASLGRGVVVSLTSGVVAAFDESGQPLWTTAAGGVSRVSAATDGEEMVYVAMADGRLTALRGDTGRVIWTRTIGGTLSAPTARDGRVYVGSSTRAVYAFDGFTGRLLWEFPTGGDVVGTAADDQSLYVAALDNVVRALHASRGSLRWKAVPPTRMISAPVLSGPRVLIGGIRPQLLAFDARIGERVTTFALPDELELAILAAAPIIFPETPEAEVSVALVTRDARIVGLSLDPPPSLPPSESASPAGQAVDRPEP